VQVLERKRRYLDVGRQVQVEPDVILTWQDTPLLVLDAKYKLAAAQGDIYQMLAYCHALGLREGVLIHPGHEEAPSGMVAIRGPGDVRVRYLALDLCGGPEEVKAQGWSLAGEVALLLDRTS
jgi:5-methylcytosine-specific restriction enzyme subunit McrC